MTMSSTPITTDLGPKNHHSRRSPRKRIETLMYVGLGLENGGFPINVSEGGMAFQGVRPLEKDQLIHINFKLPGLSASVESAAQIVWLNDLGKGGGLRFIDLPEDTRRLLNEWLSPQTSSSDFIEVTPIQRAPVKMKDLQSVPDIPVETIQDHSSVGAGGSTIETSLNASLSPVVKIDIPATSNTIAVPTHPVNSARDSRFRDAFPEIERRNAWSTPFSLGLIASLAIAAILGVILFQFHGGLQFPTMNRNPARPDNVSVMAAAPMFSPEMQTAEASPSDPTDSDSAASPAVRSAFDITGPPEGPANPGVKDTFSRPEKMARPLKISPPETLSQPMGTTAMPMTPNLKERLPAAEITLPTLTLPTNPALAPQFPLPLLEMTPPAPSPREPLQKSSKFDAAQLITRKNPVYPKVARAAGLSGSVELHFIIGADGYVRDVTVVKGNLLLARAAVEAIQTWHYQPARRDGVPVETGSSMVFVFKPN